MNLIISLEKYPAFATLQSIEYPTNNKLEIRYYYSYLGSNGKFEEINEYSKETELLEKKIRKLLSKEIYKDYILWSY